MNLETALMLELEEECRHSHFDMSLLGVDGLMPLMLIIGSVTISSEGEAQVFELIRTCEGFDEAAERAWELLKDDPRRVQQLARGWVKQSSRGKLNHYLKSHGLEFVE